MASSTVPAWLLWNEPNNRKQVIVTETGPAHAPLIVIGRIAGPSFLQLNFGNSWGTTMEATTLELKYCERCGALKLRRSNSTDNYCKRCARLLTRQLSSLRLAGRGARRACAAAVLQSGADEAPVSLVAEVLA